MLRSLAASIVLVCISGIVAAATHTSSAATRKTRVAAPEGLPLASVDDALEVRAVEHQARVREAVVAAARARALWVQQILAQRRAAALRASRAAQRRALPVESSAQAWANTPFAIRVANCESGGGPGDASPTYDGDPHLRDPNGHYGKWQFALATWWSVGGTGNPADASVAEQDYRAWLLWKRDGWGQWQCAG